MRDVVVQRRRIELPRGRELLYLLSPLPEQSSAFFRDEQRESIEIIDYLLCGRKPVYQGSRQARSSRILIQPQSLPEWCAVEVSNL